MDYAALAAEFPRLVYGHLSAWGLTGPRRDGPGYDVGAFYAYSGMMELCRASDQAPLPRYPAAFGDSLTGTQLVAGIALALLHRERTGRGQLVAVSLLRAGVWAMSHPITAHAAGNTFAAGPDCVIRRTTEIGKRSTSITDGAFKCKDGKWILLLGIESSRHWTKTVRALDMSDVLPENWQVARIELDWIAATTMVDKVVAQKNYDEWHEIFEAADVWHTPINRFEDLMNDEHTNATGSFVSVDGLKHKLVGNPILLSEQQNNSPTGRAPGFGEHTTQIAQELGYKQAEIQSMKDRGVLK